ncbi:MAG: DUF4835 family protein [Candidatus Marinimicrobia bacterium]|nr:DUF4835 family protein [Candidatus Neomarinimicrobiota bacterium]
MIDTRQVRENDRYIFESFGDDVSQYLTNNKFTDNAFELELFLDIHFIIESYSSSDNNKIVNAQMILTNQADQQYYAKGVDFPYSKGQSLSFSPMFSPLTSVLDYYANLFIATELDTYDYLGGDAYFVNSDEITNSGRSSDYSRGWENRKKKAKKLKENRHLRSIRFHYFAVQDILHAEEIDRKSIMVHLEECIEDVDSILEIYGNDRNTSQFLNVYGKDLAQLFKHYKLTHAIHKLSEVDPDNNSIYSKFLDK